MARVFVSHAGADFALACEVRGWLSSPYQGWRGFAVRVDRLSVPVVKDGDR